MLPNPLQAALQKLCFHKETSPGSTNPLFKNPHGKVHGCAITNKNPSRTLESRNFWIRRVWIPTSDTTISKAIRHGRRRKPSFCTAKVNVCHGQPSTSQEFYRLSTVQLYANSADNKLDNNCDLNAFKKDNVPEHATEKIGKNSFMASNRSWNFNLWRLWYSELAGLQILCWEFFWIQLRVSLCYDFSLKNVCLSLC